ncbi:MAG: 4Fe-4S binding protein [Syntrophorhabdus aromaticivorans]|uniref:histidine kinase n=1 Tax=Syntrophorhabdus aromaticivorans TaxID=328301 RepID=A0A971S169_9BACT|nr:4Fe-4S binding protein [Syntrophorhabdus aromaticivorans]
MAMTAPAGKQNPYDINVNNKKCRRCSYCVQICPAKAIKVEKGGFRVIPERCVLCGRCIRACPQQALSYHGGIPRVKEFFAEGRKTIACLDPSFPVERGLGTARQIVTALKEVGFTEVWEGAFGAELVSQIYYRMLRDEVIRPLISSFCPVIVFYIQKYYPHLIPNLAPVVSPMIAVGRVARQVKGPDWKVVYISPCLARMGEIVAPEVAGAIDEVITFVDARKLIEEAGIDKNELSDTEFDGPKPYQGRIIPVIGGLYRNVGPSFDVLTDEISVIGGYRRTIGALQQLAEGSIQAKFLDFVFCYGCVDGPFAERDLSILARRQIIAQYTKTEMTKQDIVGVMAELDRFKDVDLGRTFRNMEQKLPAPTEDEIRAVLKEIGKLPPNRNLDCRACGYPSCRDKAIAVAQGIARVEYCLPYLLERSKKIYQQLEKSHRELQLSHNELEQAHAQLIRTEKLASIGQLAAGVAHEINNPLGTITIYAHLMQKSLEPDDPRKEDMALIISEANRAKEIVQGLLSFARETKLRASEVSVNDVLEDVLDLVVNQSLFHNIKIKKSLDPDLPTIIADEAQLKQVFLNIILNAAQAMEGSGKLSIGTSNDRKQVKVRIQDTGPGIPPEVMGNLFTPFVTTKEKGTGLGLAISYGIVERHEGKIDVETEMGKGSTFTISLPIGASGDGEKDGAEVKQLLVKNTKIGRGNYE